jgi:hypothetical protein
MTDPTEACHCGTYPDCACGEVHKLRKALELVAQTGVIFRDCVDREYQMPLRVFDAVIEAIGEAKP